MPTRPKRPCLRPGCAALVENGYCKIHAEYARLPDKWRGSSHSRGYGAAHRRIREATMRRDSWLCQRCLAEGRTTPATDSHHKMKLRTRPDLHLVHENRVSLCRECHEILEKETT